MTVVVSPPPNLPMEVKPTFVTLWHPGKVGFLSHMKPTENNVTGIEGLKLSVGAVQPGIRAICGAVNVAIMNHNDISNGRKVHVTLNMDHPPCPPLRGKWRSLQKLELPRLRLREFMRRPFYADYLRSQPARTRPSCRRYCRRHAPG